MRSGRSGRRCRGCERRARAAVARRFMCGVWRVASARAAVDTTVRVYAHFACGLKCVVEMLAGRQNSHIFLHFLLTGLGPCRFPRFFSKMRVRGKTGREHGARCDRIEGECTGGPRPPVVDRN
eukprot:6550415-Prymnesium_polylepis.1